MTFTELSFAVSLPLCNLVLRIIFRYEIIRSLCIVLTRAEQENDLHRIDLLHDCPEAVHWMITYFYTLDYDDMSTEKSQRHINEETADRAAIAVSASEKSLLQGTTDEMVTIDEYAGSDINRDPRHGQIVAPATALIRPFLPRSSITT